MHSTLYFQYLQNCLGVDAKNARHAADDLQALLSKEIELFFKITECQKELAEISLIQKPVLERHFTEKVRCVENSGNPK